MVFGGHTDSITDLIGTGCLLQGQASLLCPEQNKMGKMVPSITVAFTKPHVAFTKQNVLGNPQPAFLSFTG